MSEDYEAIIDFWLGGASRSAKELERRNRMWFRPDPKTDAGIATRFGDLLLAQAAGVNQSWQTIPRGRLGLIILFDQFPRNIYRGTAQAFAFDAQALDLCQRGIDAGVDRGLKAVERMFFYMPLQHAEALEPQDRSVALFEALAKSCPAGQQGFFNEALRHAREHRDLIARFGRFPHRNRALGRASTAEEMAHLEGAGGAYGQ